MPPDSAHPAAFPSPSGGLEQPAAPALRLPYSPPFSWPRLLAFLAGRATPGVERVAGGSYSRTVSVGGAPAVVTVSPAAGAPALEVRVHGALPAKDTAARLRRLLDTDAPAEAIGRAFARDRLLARLLTRAPGVRVPGAWDGFELTVRAVRGQQVSVRAATTLAGRIALRYGEVLHPPVRTAALVRLFPTPERLCRARFNGIGIVGSRAETLRRIAAAALAGDLVFDPAQDPDDFRRALTAIRGVGDWTAQYVSMRFLKDPDAMPVSDLGLLKALSRGTRATPAELARRAERWRPWRAYAAMLLWSLPEAGGG